MAGIEAPEEVEAIVGQLRRLLATKDDSDRRWGSAKCGVYLFYDYDGEPIYVGQTRERLSSRIGRHLTGGRSDSVAKFVLDPFEVADIEVFPLWHFEDANVRSKAVKDYVNATEYTLYMKAVRRSRFGAVLNEQRPKQTELVSLPKGFRGGIIPDDVYERRKHPDIRIARRAHTIANLARIISERKLREPSGLRDTLKVQAQRLELLTANRLAEVEAAYPGREKQAEEDDENVQNEG